MAAGLKNKKGFSVLVVSQCGSNSYKLFLPHLLHAGSHFMFYRLGGTVDG
jgi:hypothetical protein